MEIGISLLALCVVAVQGGRIPTTTPPAKFQDAIDIAVPLEGGRAVKLSLRRSDVVNASLPVYLGTDRYTFSRWDSRSGRDFAVYEDPERRASFVMWEADGGDPDGAGMRAIVRDGGRLYQLEPIRMRQHVAYDPSAFVSPPQPDAVVRINGVPLTVNEVNGSALPDTDLEHRLTDDIEALTKDVKDFVERGKKLGFTYPKYYYEVELFLVADYALFDRWLRLSRAVDYRDREREAIDNIRFYFAHVLHGIGRRYAGLDDQALRVDIRPVGIYVAKTRSASYWTEGFGIKEAYAYTEAYKALDAFEEWINAGELGLPPFDQATLYTGNRLFSGWYGGRRRTISGLADIRGVCGPKRASINRDIGVYASIQTGAHELGHNLGAFHDGYNNPCSSRDQYIMATSPGALDDRNRDNPTRFSYCSRNAIWEYLLFLSGKGENCLLARQNDRPWDIRHELSTEPGERYGADEQCKIVYGLQSFYCGGGDRDRSICSIMYCWDPAERQCKGDPEQRAADRTQCGDRRWCRRGECVYDGGAPAAADPDCVYGDYRGVVSDDRKCYDLGIAEPHRCYEESFRKRCCDTCRRAQRRNQDGCPFGDRDPDYCRANVRSSDCYDANTRQLCCETCAKYETGRSGCEYGDKLSYCPTLPKYRCYEEGDDCCDTCRWPPPGATPGCEWGDRASWCRDLDVRSCENAKTRATCCATCRGRGPAAGRTCSGPDLSRYCPEIVTSGARCYRNEKQCCATCAPFYTGSPDCQYGDKFEWCPGYVERNRYACDQDPFVREHCCKSCAASGPAQASCADSAPWCGRIHPGQCYNANTEKTCCATCKRHLRSSPSCRYGDEVTWCKQEYCATSAQYCCETCR